MKETHPLTDFYPEGWQVYDHIANEKLNNLLDTTPPHGVFLNVISGDTVTVIEPSASPVEITSDTTTPDPEVASTLTEPGKDEIKKDSKPKTPKKSTPPKKKK